MTLQERIAELTRLHGGLRAAALACDIDVGYFKRLRDGEKVNPSESTLIKLGLEKMVIYVLR